MPGLTGWGVSRDLVRPALRTFHARWEETNQEVEEPTAIHLDSATLRSGEQDAPHPEAGEQPVKRFEAELSALGGNFKLCRRSELANALLEFLQGREVTRIQAWDPDCLPEGILDRLEAAGIRIQQSADPAIQVGLTGALAAAADTGTLVLPAGAGRSPHASLLPEIHLALLPLESILPSLPDVLKLAEIQTASSVALISGPSRTADIEMTLTIGVHGPAEVHVFCWQ